jgi:glycosyltransferase involved in cell wall biosynthesis
MHGGREELGSVDVVMLTKNSMRPSLPETIASVFANIPVKRLIVVDGGSSDGTVEYVSKQMKAVLVDDSEGNRATARQKGIEMVETELFAFVDADIILQRDWFVEARKLLGPDVGAVSTYPRYFGTAGEVQRALERMYGRPTRRRFDTAAALLRTAAAKGIRIPNEDEDVPSEDEFIGREVLKRGYRVLCAGTPVAYHQESPHPPDLMAKGGLLRAEGWRSTRDMLREFALSIPEGLFVLLFTGSFSAGWQRVRNKGVALLGFLLSARP